MKKEKEKKEKIEACVLCGKPTPYLITTPINEREGYVEGCGQVCEDCRKTL